MDNINKGDLKDVSGGGLRALTAEVRRRREEGETTSQIIEWLNIEKKAVTYSPRRFWYDGNPYDKAGYELKAIDIMIQRVTDGRV